MYTTYKTITKVNLIKQAVRYHRHIVRRKTAIDPGIQRRKDLIKEEHEIQHLQDYDFDMEADFMNVGKTYDQHMEELTLKQEKQKYLIIKQKYFKEKLPNFLSWNDKEQIRYLHNNNPEEWTIEKLSEGFPALPEVIIKILKSTWTKTNEKQIQNHDKSVQQNWLLFKEGKLTTLHPELVEHLNKFIDRDLNLKSFKVSKAMKLKNKGSMLSPNVKIGTEFSEIIKSYEQLKSNNRTEELDVTNKNKVQKPPKEDTYVLNNSNSKYISKHITLGCLQNKILKKAQDEKLPADEKVMLQEMAEAEQSIQIEQQQLMQQNVKSTSSSSAVDLSQNKFTSGEITTSDNNKNEYNFLNYPEKIAIPKDKLKRGYTYKLNDCYYDDDGEFLYRVPGMYK